MPGLRELGRPGITTVGSFNLLLVKFCRLHFCSSYADNEVFFLKIFVTIFIIFNSLNS